jgi:TolB-like protein
VRLRSSFNAAVDEPLDAKARAAYKQRIVALREELEDARELRDEDRVASLEDEIDFITRELSLSLGLGGRSSRIGSAAEQARINVTKSIRRAMGQIAANNDALGRLLKSTIKTGTFCSYNPDPRFPLEWRFEPEEIVANTAPVEVIEEALEAMPRRAPQGWAKRMLLGASGAFLAALLAFGASAWWRSSTRSVIQSHAIRSLVVLPLKNFSSDPALEYFSDGLSDELTTDLAKIAELRVISGTSALQYQETHVLAATQVARGLNADAVVEGSVLRLGDRVRIAIQLIDARPGKHLRAETFERNFRDVLGLEDDVASAITRQINLRLTREERPAGECTYRQPGCLRSLLEGAFFSPGAHERRESHYD